MIFMIQKKKELKEYIIMANHASAIKRVRQTETRRIRNKYYARTMRSALKKLREETKKKEAEASLPGIYAMLDKLAKRNIIHKKKANNLKSKLTKRVNSL